MKENRKSNKAINYQELLRPFNISIEDYTETVAVVRQLACALLQLTDKEVQEQAEKDENFGTQLYARIFARTSYIELEHELQATDFSSNLAMTGEKYPSLAADVITLLASRCKLRLTKSQYEKILRYYYLRLAVNQHLNLSRIKKAQDIVTSDIFDSFMLAGRIKEALNSSAAGKLLDIGTGAGIPGIILAILLPELTCDLLDTVRKKLAFLDFVCRDLQLPCNLLWQRVEDYAHSQARHSYNFVVARAVSSLPTLLEYSLPLVKIGSFCFCLKTTNEPELSAAKLRNLLGALSLPPAVYSLPPAAQANFPRQIMAYRQVASVASTYPRLHNLPRTRMLEIAQELS
ncbi:16S rRNA (guanine(527)-N(7))-methyltransferase RsmG [Amygdalobacter indicium]|uniref:16S rRNA (guanine(527)-N(7))-methyltransferase RsmG n=1 Tax=Amygdalobacter indicium TaxID=3029272 RepID=UPI0027AA76FB|nr:16S rRNA (guanine(527)-N(7))-methyltransferase RsmG [Amygdalobacter indicium]WEG33983.1 16S rRNA (guanine(527)-N(7))-methyltransferase RsmG [Amygdalobacter indicium]